MGSFIHTCRNSPDLCYEAKHVFLPEEELLQSDKRLLGQTPIFQRIFESFNGGGTCYPLAATCKHFYWACTQADKIHKVDRLKKVIKTFPISDRFKKDLVSALERTTQSNQETTSLMTTKIEIMKFRLHMVRILSKLKEEDLFKDEYKIAYERVFSYKSLSLVGFTKEHRLLFPLGYYLYLHSATFIPIDSTLYLSSLLMQASSKTSVKKKDRILSMVVNNFISDKDPVGALAIVEEISDPATKADKHSDLIHNFSRAIEKRRLSSI